MVMVNGRSYTQREYEHIQVVMAETGSPPAYLADTPPSQLPPPIETPTAYQQETIERSAAITVTPVYEPAPVYVAPTVVKDPTPPADTTFTTTSEAQVEVNPAEVISEPAAQRYALKIGFWGNPPANLDTWLFNRAAPIAARFGYTLTAVFVNPSEISFVFEKGSPVVIGLVYALLALIAIVFVGIVVIYINWTSLKTSEIEAVEVSDISEVIAGVQADPNIDQATKNQLMLELSKAMGSAVEPTGLEKITPMVSQVVPLLLVLAVVGAIGKATK